MSGFYLSLGPSLAVVLLHSRSHIVGALVPAALCLTTAIASVLTRRWSSRRSLALGTLVLAAGVLVTLVGIRTRSAAPLFAGSALAGLGFGPAFAGSLRSLTPLADAGERAGLLAAVYFVSYLAFAVPAVLAGLAAAHWGLRDSATGYAIAVIVLAGSAGALASRREPVTPR